MKFCKNLRRLVVISDPEWAPYWTNYKMLKKLIKEMDLDEEDPASYSTVATTTIAGTNTSGDATANVPPPTKRLRRGGEDKKQQQESSGVGGDALSPSIQQQQTRGDSMSERLAAAAARAAQRKAVAHTRTPATATTTTTTAPITTTTKTATTLTTATTCSKKRKNTTTSNRHPKQQPTACSNSRSSLTTTAATTTTMPTPSTRLNSKLVARVYRNEREALGRSPVERAFFRLLHSEFKKALYFVSTAETEFSVREKRMQHSIEIYSQQQEEEATSFVVVDGKSGVHSPPRQQQQQKHRSHHHQQQHHHHHSYDQATMIGENKWHIMAKSIYRLYRDMLHLESFCIMTVFSFSKILKKHDKVTGHATREAFMQNVVLRDTNLVEYPALLQMIARTQNMYNHVMDLRRRQYECSTSSSGGNGNGGDNYTDDEALFLNVIQQIQGYNSSQQPDEWMTVSALARSSVATSSNVSNNRNIEVI